MAEGSILTNPNALNDTYLPEQLLYSWNQVKLMAEAIEPLLDGQTSKTVLLHGPSGAGKTTAARFFLEYLKEQSLEVRSGYVNCWNDYSRFDTLTALARSLGLPLIRGRLSANEVLFRVEGLTQKYQCTVALDEVDQLEDKKLLYRFGMLDCGLIMITNDARQLYRLDSRIKSRLEPIESIHFPAYSNKELMDILEVRAQVALRPHSVSKQQIRRMVVSSGHNAHVAIESLKIASQRADSDYSSRILDKHVRFAIAEARQAVRTKSLSRLNEHQQKLLEIVKKAKEISSGELHKRYRGEMVRPVTGRAIRNYLSKMVRYGFLVAKGEGRWREYVLNA